MSESREELIKSIWTPPSSWSFPGTWFWWFWLFFIHDENTEKTGRCRQLMILWSIKKDKRISCNSLDIQIPIQIERENDLHWTLNGAAAAWYFDGESMHDDFVLEKSSMELDGEKLSLIAPGSTPSSFFLENGEFVTKIKTNSSSGPHEFEFRARQVDMNPIVGPVRGTTKLPLGMEVGGTMIERFVLSGTEIKDGKTIPLTGSAYFQKILVGAPPPQWYWGVYHFKDGSIFNFMVTYAGQAALADNAWKGAHLGKPFFPISQDIAFYHAPSGKVYHGKNVSLMPKDEGNDLWSHTIKGKGKDFEIEAFARAYAHSCWRFEKNLGPLPIKSTFKYNEYPAVLERLSLKTEEGKTIELEMGWGNMENSWGFLL